MRTQLEQRGRERKPSYRALSPHACRRSGRGLPFDPEGTYLERSVALRHKFVRCPCPTVDPPCHPPHPMHLRCIACPCRVAICTDIPRGIGYLHREEAIACARAHAPSRPEPKEANVLSCATRDGGSIVLKAPRCMQSMCAAEGMIK